MENLTTESQLAELIENSGKTFIWAILPDCDFCKSMEAILDNLEKSSPDTTFLRLDSSQFPEMAYDLGIDVVPSMIYIQNGRILRRFSGIQSMSDLEKGLSFSVLPSPIVTSPDAEPIEPIAVS